MSANIDAMIEDKIPTRKEIHRTLLDLEERTTKAPYDFSQAIITSAAITMAKTLARRKNPDFNLEAAKKFYFNHFQKLNNQYLAKQSGRHKNYTDCKGNPYI